MKLFPFVGKLRISTFKLDGPMATEPLRGDSLLFTTNPSEIPGIHLINLRGLKV